MSSIQGAEGRSPLSLPIDVGMVRELLRAVGRGDGPGFDVTTGLELVEELCRLPLEASRTVVDHAFGIVPLMHLFEEDSSQIRSIRAGRSVTSLNILTPNPDFSLCGTVVHGGVEGGRVELVGRVRVGSGRACFSMVLADVGGIFVLCLVPLQHTPDHLREGSPGTDGGYWVDLEGLSVASTSVAVDLNPLGALGQCIQEHASAAAYLSAAWSTRLLVAVRLAMAQGGRMSRFDTSQLAAHEITRLEIEAELLRSAVRRTNHLGEGRGMVLLAASIGLLLRVTRIREGWEAGLGMEFAGGSWSQPTSAALLGEMWMSEGEVARHMGLFPGTA